MSEADEMFEELGYKKEICDLFSEDFSKKLFKTLLTTKTNYAII